MRHRENTESLIDMKQLYEFWGNTSILCRRLRCGLPWLPCRFPYDC